MDELLSLFGVDGSQDERPVGAGASDVQQSDVASSFGAAFGVPGDATPVHAPKPAPARHDAHPRKTAASAKQDSTPCDPITGLRIVDRRTSRADMVDAFSAYTYRSCSVLAAASRAEWNANYLVDGGSGGNGPPAGKTNLATCGILTSDTSSRLSKAGRAYAMLSLGDLPSSMQSRGSAFSKTNNIHASINVFLFGDALGVLRNHKKYVSTGYAVAVLGANLMPPRDGDKSTSITLSVNDPRQILPIGRAVDCGRCKGTVKVRATSAYGGEYWEDSRCSTLVDLRLGDGYCPSHRHQGLSSGGSGGNAKRSNNSNMTFMQRQRMQGMPAKGGANNNNIHRRPGNRALGGAMGGRTAPSSLSEALSQSGLLEPAPALPTAPKPPLMRRAALHMKKTSSSTSANKNASNSVASNATRKAPNPYQKKTQNSNATSKRKGVDDILGEALARKKTRLTTTASASKKAMKQTSKPCKVFHTEGYDGAVQVPKPSKVLFQRSTIASMAKVAPSPVDNALSTQAVLEKQRYLAGLLKEKDGAASARPTAEKKKKKYVLNKESLARSKQQIFAKGGIKSAQTKAAKSPPQSTDAFAAAFGAAGGASAGKSFDRNAIFNAKSLFASAVDAQEYARARAVVQELEVREGSKQQGKNSDKQSSKAAPSIVTTSWACRTCKQKTPYKPASCIHARHDVRQVRELKGGAKGLGTRKERLDRHGKDSDDGGLTLGSGLEWSGWRGDFN